MRAEKIHKDTAASSRAGSGKIKEAKKTATNLKRTPADQSWNNLNKLDSNRIEL